MLKEIGSAGFVVALLGCLFCIFWYHRFKGGHLFALPIGAVLCPIIVSPRGGGSTPEILPIAILSGLFVLYPIVHGSIALFIGAIPWVTEGRGTEYIGDAKWVKYARVPLEGRPARRYWLAVVLLPLLFAAGWGCFLMGMMVDRWQAEASDQERKAGLLSQLKGDDAAKRFKAASMLATGYCRDLQPEEEARIIQELSEGLSHAKPLDKRSAIDRVSELKAQPEAVVRLLRAAMKDSDSDTRCNAIRGLTGHELREHAKVAFDEIIALARNEPDAKVRFAAEMAVMRFDPALYDKEFKRK